MTNPNKVGLVVGVLIGGWHLLWSLLVLLGWAQPFIDFIFWAHMIQPIYVIKAFDPKAALTLVVITFTTGYNLRVRWRDHLEPITSIVYQPRASAR